VPECQKIKKSGLDEYGAERFGRLSFASQKKSLGLKGLSCTSNTTATNSTVVCLLALLDRPYSVFAVILPNKSTLCLKKVSTFELSVTLSNHNRVPKFLYCWKAYEICYKTHATLPISL